MKGLWSEHFPAAEKPPAQPEASPLQKMKGLWSEHFPAAEMPPAQAESSPSQKKEGLSEHSAAAEKPPAPLGRYQTCLICSSCDAAISLRTSASDQNPGRNYYACPSREHKFFKWADEVKAEQLIDVPYCGGCNAGVCRVRREKTGPNAGRVLFMCRVKEGDGSCGYRVWKDELEKMSDIDQTTANCNETAHTHINDLAEGSNENDNGADNESPVINSSKNLQCIEVTTRKIDQLKCRDHKSSESSKRPPKRSRYGDLKDRGSLVSALSLKLHLPKNSVSRHCWIEAAISQNLSSQLRGWWGRLAFGPMPFLMPHTSKPFTIYVSSPLDSTFVVQDKFLVNSNDPIFPSRVLPEVESSSNQLLNPGQNAVTNTFLETRVDNVMSKSISKAFSLAAEILQNDLLTLLETTDVKDHEAMTRAAEATFAALDCLLHDHHDFKICTKDFIDCAISLAEIEESMTRNDSYQELVDHCSSERMRLDEMERGHAEMVDALSNSKKLLKGMQEDISSALDLLFDIRAELACCEVELENMEEGTEVLEQRYVLARKELEVSEKLRELREAEYDAAKAAFDRAKILLRG